MPILGEVNGIPDDVEKISLTAGIGDVDTSDDVIAILIAILMMMRMTLQ